MRVWISDEFVIKTWFAWEQTCCWGKVKYLTKIEEKTRSSNHIEDDDIYLLYRWCHLCRSPSTYIHTLKSWQGKWKLNDSFSLKTWKTSSCILLQGVSEKSVFLWNLHLVASRCVQTWFPPKNELQWANKRLFCVEVYGCKVRKMRFFGQKNWPKTCSWGSCEKLSTQTSHYLPHFN